MHPSKACPVVHCVMDVRSQHARRVQLRGVKILSSFSVIAHFAFQDIVMHFPKRLGIDCQTRPGAVLRNSNGVGN
jgi:hypothetical protein